MFEKYSLHPDRVRPVGVGRSGKRRSRTQTLPQPLKPKDLAAKPFLVNPRCPNFLQYRTN